MVGVGMKDECTVTFSVTCELEPSHHVRLVRKREGHWDYQGGEVLTRKEGGGADLSSMFYTLHLCIL